MQRLGLIPIKIVMIAGLLVLLQWPASAAMKLSIMPEDGTNSLRFGRVGLPTTLNKEVNFRITTDEDQQYQVFQRLSSPFFNERGEQLSEDVLMSAGVPGSNSVGNLDLQNAERLGFSEQLIYTSSAGGLSDSFALVYQVNAEDVTANGNFSGDILYTLRPIGGGAQEEIVLRAYFDISSDLSIRSESSSGSDYLRLDQSDVRADQGYVRFDFDGNRDRELKIYQSMIDLPRDELNRSLDENVVKFFTSGGESGELNYQDRTNLASRRLLIYTTDSAQDSVFVNYMIDEETKDIQRAGTYFGKVQFDFESTSFADTKNIDLEVTIPPVFEMETAFPPEGVSFEGLLPTSEPQLKEVIVSVKSNLGKVYVVNQRVVGTLSNEEGQPFDNDFFNVKQELIDGSSGEVNNEEFVPVSEGDATLFFSDNAGTSSQFKVTYRLQPYPKMQPGDYQMAVVYSISEI